MTLIHWFENNVRMALLVEWLNLEEIKGEIITKQIKSEWLKAQGKHGNLQYPDSITVMSVTKVVFKNKCSFVDFDPHWTFTKDISFLHEMPTRVSIHYFFGISIKVEIMARLYSNFPPERGRYNYYNIVESWLSWNLLLSLASEE